jgi:hypothetical protein
LGRPWPKTGRSTIEEEEEEEEEEEDMYYRRTDKKYIRQDLKIFNLGEKVKQCQRHYFEHILRTTTYRIPKILKYHQK